MHLAASLATSPTPARLARIASLPPSHLARPARLPHVGRGSRGQLFAGAPHCGAGQADRS
eukprot:1788894-Alexandrium_andersonii.AAC.1